jgi:hypothetical protein
MRKVREVLRLRHALRVSERQIAITIGVSRSTVGEYLRRAAVIGITRATARPLGDHGGPARPRLDQVTSQLPVEYWREIIGDPTLADAILDRLVHNAHRLTLKGDSLRKAEAKRQKLDAETAN